MTPATSTKVERKVEETHIPMLDRTFLHDFPRWDMLDEPYLIASILAGDQEAFAVLVQPYLHLFTIGIHRIVHDLEGTQEALEEALLNIYSELNLITDRNAFFTWAYRVCLHEGLLLRRARSGSVAKFRGQAPSSF